MYVYRHKVLCGIKGDNMVDERQVMRRRWCAFGDYHDYDEYDDDGGDDDDDDYDDD